MIDPQIAGGVTIGIAISNEVPTVGEITVKNATMVCIEGKSSDAHLMMAGVEVKNVTVKLTSAESFHARDLESPNSSSTMPRVLHQHWRRIRSSNGRRVDHLQRNVAGHRKSR